VGGDIQYAILPMLTCKRHADEEDAFWMLASVLEKILPSDYYSSQLLVSQADQRVLQDLIQLALPDVRSSSTMFCVYELTPFSHSSTSI